MPELCSLDQPNHSLQAYAVWTMTHITNKPIPKLHSAPKPPLSYPGAAADSDRAKKPRLAEPPANDQDLNPGDRVEGLGNFGKASVRHFSFSIT